jgi:hypothetical protein
MPAVYDSLVHQQVQLPLVDDGSGPREAVPAQAPAVPRKAAHWRFEERAYRAWTVSL